MCIRDSLTPAVLLGFSFDTPQDNIYIGGTIEPLKSLQVLAGLHVGKVTVKRTPEAVDDPHISTDPATDQRYKPGFFVGASFNIGFIKTIFGKS